MTKKELTTKKKNCPHLKYRPLELIAGYREGDENYYPKYVQKKVCDECGENIEHLKLSARYTYK